MQITIPMYAIQHGKIGGVESAIYNLVRGLYENGEALRIAYSDPNRLSPEFQSWISNAENLQKITGGINRPRALPRFVEEFMFAQGQRAVGEVTLFPNYFAPAGLISRRNKTAVIIHDSQYKVFPQFFSRKKRWWLDFCYRRSLEQCDAVLLISNHEKQMIGRWFGERFLPKCHVVYNAIDWRRFEVGRAAQATLDAIKRPYVLSVSHQFPHKNVGKLVRAFGLMSEQDSDLCLYLVGKVSEEVIRVVHQELTESARSRVILFGFISDADLGALYRSAKAFVLPSLYEGFGMPAVEALGFGVPTIVSDAAALPEVTRGRAKLVNTLASDGDWADTLRWELSSRRATDGMESLAEFRKFYSPEAVASRVRNTFSSF